MLSEGSGIVWASQSSTQPEKVKEPAHRRELTSPHRSLSRSSSSSILESLPKRKSHGSSRDGPMSRIISFARDPIRFLSKAVLAWDLVLWLFWLPVMLRIHTVPMLLKRLAEQKAYQKNADEVTRGCRNRNPHMQSEAFSFTVLPQALPPPIAHAIPDIEPNGISG